MSARLLGLALLLACTDAQSPAPSPANISATFRVALGIDSAGRGIDSLRVSILDSARTVRANTRSDCVHLTVPVPTNVEYQVFTPVGIGTATLPWRADSGRANLWATAAWGNKEILFAQYMIVRAPCDTIAGIADR